MAAIVPTKRASCAGSEVTSTVAGLPVRSRLAAAVGTGTTTSTTSSSASVAMGSPAESRCPSSVAVCTT